MAIADRGFCHLGGGAGPHHATRPTLGATPDRTRQRERDGPHGPRGVHRHHAQVDAVPGPKPAVDGTRVTRGLPRWYADRFKALAEAAAVPVVSLHTARHGYGSHLLDQGVPLPIVSQAMGHGSVDVTAIVYAHALKSGADDRVRAAMVAAGL